MNVMREILEKLIDESTETAEGAKAVPLQLYFKNSIVQMTQRGSAAENVFAGAVRRSPIAGLFILTSVGMSQDKQPVMFDCYFEAESLFRIDHPKGRIEQRIIRPSGEPTEIPRIG
jgi:hypothetical protein